jgi:DNA polymerase III sliding clamp (beta) subunit (PCNA family)
MALAANKQEIEAQAFAIEPRVFADRLRRAIPFMNKEDTRWYICGVLMAYEPKKLTLVATNGEILLEQVIRIGEKQNEPFQVILPGEAVKHLAELLRSAQLLRVTLLADGRVEFSAGDFVYTTKTIDATYPDYLRVIPKGTGAVRHGFNASYILAALGALGNNAVDIAVDSDKVFGRDPHLLTSSEAEGIRVVVMPLRIDN